ncbi:hypothetical protein LSTR_LSTR000046 [Laodelphax striatellus]|uniref:MADF domain-containing protein n=1 Tax=Laodelphax striatellus TaxID=195883 RepID=A0A482X6M5_LAOST|nr:hypothetical protein LSTR_LSTR000046 [Laodelphax striatellus]
MYEMNSKMFTIEQDEKLIEIVRNHPMLYDTDRKDYRDMELKMKVWKTISETFGFSPEVCHVRWRTIRDTHRRNVNRTKSKGKTSFKSKYTKQIIEFLDSTFKDKPLVFADDPDSVVKVELEEVDCSESLDSSNQGEKDERFESFVDDYIELEASSNSPPLSSEAPPAKKKKKKKIQYPKLTNTVSLENVKSAWDAREKDPLEIVKRGSDKVKNSHDEVKSIWEGRGKIRDITENGKSGCDDPDKTRSELSEEKVGRVEVIPIRDHPVDNFFSNMADIVKTFPPHLIAEARMKVCQIVSELELRALQRDDLVLAPPPSSNLILLNQANSRPPIQSRPERPRDPLSFESPHYLQL